MFAASPSPHLRERLTLLTLAAVQFTHLLDYMILMPLGSHLMRMFAINPAQFTHLVAAYGFAAAVTGFAGGFLMDRLDRRRSRAGPTGPRAVQLAGPPEIRGKKVVAMLK